MTKYSFNDDFITKISIEDRKFKVPKDCFKSIIFGYKMLESDIEEIIQLCSQQELKVIFFKASPTDEGSVDLEPFNYNL